MKAATDVSLAPLGPQATSTSMLVRQSAIVFTPISPILFRLAPPVRIMITIVCKKQISKGFRHLGLPIDLDGFDLI
jgi:hypothetical protein